MSLIERAVDKLGPQRTERAEALPLPEQAAAAKAVPSVTESLVSRAVAAGARYAPEPVEPPAKPAPVAAPSVVAVPSQPVVRPTPTVVPANKAPVAAPNPAPSTKAAPVRIPIEMLRARGFVTPDAAPTAISQEFRVIKRPLLANAFGRGTTPVKNGRRVMVTSAFAGEGKSFCAINLAMSIAAERDTYVLLVDADVAKPSIPRELGIESGPGLMDCLIDPARDVGELVQPTNIERLSLLPAGRNHEQATELLASASMKELIDHLSDRYEDRIIIFDSPPIMMTTEARVLASYMGQIVMVVEAGVTPREAVTDALASIGSPEVVGMVLNKAREARGARYQGYGYAG
jgi:exopolysaccharide/PEP-CTERM locus tyrosine autokinase